MLYGDPVAHPWRGDYRTGNGSERRRNLFRNGSRSSRPSPLCPRSHEVMDEGVDVFCVAIGGWANLESPIFPNLQGIWSARLVTVKFIDFWQLEDDHVSAADDPADSLLFLQDVYGICRFGVRVVDLDTPRLAEQSPPFPGLHFLDGRQIHHCFIIACVQNWVSPLRDKVATLGAYRSYRRAVLEGSPPPCGRRAFTRRIGVGRTLRTCT